MGFYRVCISTRHSLGFYRVCIKCYTSARGVKGKTTPWENPRNWSVGAQIAGGGGGNEQKVCP